MKREREKVEEELRQTLRNTRSEVMKQIEEANSKVWTYEEKMKEMERKMY